MKVGPRHISPKFYKKILEVLPVACADAVIVSRGPLRSRSSPASPRRVEAGEARKPRLFLLGKRKNKPARGEWFFIGGRILKGEKLEDSLRRHIELETGIKSAKIKKLLGACETIFKTSAQGPSSHTVNFVYLSEIPRGKILPADDEHSEIRWFSRIDRKWHPYVREMLRKAGFK